MDPLTTITAAKITAGQVAREVVMAAGVSVLAFSMTTQEVGVAITALTIAGGVVIWAVRVQSTVQNLGAAFEKMDRRIEKIADRLGVVE